MEEQKLVVNLADGQKELNILTGEYRHEENTKKKVSINGTITAPGLYVTHLRNNERLNTFLPMVTVDMEKLLILFNSDPRDSYGEIVTGRLEYVTDTVAIGINGTKRYTVDTLKQFVRMNRVLFPNEAAYNILLTAIQNFSAKLTKEYQNKNDNRGNKVNIETSVLDHDIPFDFNIIVPIFKGCPEVTVNVLVCLDISGSGVQFWFESPELKAAEDKQKIEVMQEEIENFEGLNVMYL